MLFLLNLFDMSIVLLNLIFIILNILVTVVLGIILYSLCEVNGLKGKSVLSFIPVGNVYILNELLGERVHEKLRKHLWIIYAVFFILSLLIPKLSITTTIIFAYYMYLLLKECWIDNTKVLFHLILGIVTSGITYPLSLYQSRSKRIEVTTRDMEEDKSLGEFIVDIEEKIKGFVTKDNSSNSVEYSTEEVEPSVNNNNNSNESSGSSSSSGSRIRLR